MQQTRLLGLILFITTIFLAMAAVATQTQEIRLFDGRNSSQPVNEAEQTEEAIPKFVSIPILWPLAIAGGIGLVLWFVPAPREPSVKRKRRRRQR